MTLFEGFCLIYRSHYFNNFRNQNILEKLFLEKRMEMPSKNIRMASIMKALLVEIIVMELGNFSIKIK